MIIHNMRTFHQHFCVLCGVDHVCVCKRLLCLLIALRVCSFPLLVQMLCGCVAFVFVVLEALVWSFTLRNET